MYFANACSAVLTVLCIAALGFLLTRRGWITEDIARFLPKFLTTIVLPPFLMRSITTSFTRDQLLLLLSGSLVPFISILLCFSIAALLARLCRVRIERRGVFMCGFSMSNTMNIGLPINIALYGEAAIPFVLLYFFANVTLFWTMGNYCIAHDGDGAHVRLFSLESARKILSPPLLGFAAGLAVVVTGLEIPVFLDKTFKYVGDMTIGLAVMYIGIMLHGVKLSEYRMEKDVVLVIVGRFLISPLTIMLVSLILPIPDMMRKVFIIQASLPVMMNSVVLAGYYRADAKYAAVLISLTTLMSMVTVPVLAVLMGSFSL